MKKDGHFPLLLNFDECAERGMLLEKIIYDLITLIKKKINTKEWIRQENGKHEEQKIIDDVITLILLDKVVGY